MLNRKNECMIYFYWPIIIHYWDIADSLYGRLIWYIISQCRRTPVILVCVAQIEREPNPARDLMRRPVTLFIVNKHSQRWDESNDVSYHLIELKKPSEFGLCNLIRTEVKSGTRLDASSDHNFFPYMHSRQCDKSDDVSLLAVGQLFYKLLADKGFALDPL